MSDSVKSAPASEPEQEQRPEIATVVQLPRSLSGQDSASAESLVRLMKLASARGKDRLQTIAKMAEGGMGQIHLAVDHVLQRRVAKKVINPELKKDLLHVRRASGMRCVRRT